MGLAAITRKGWVKNPRKQGLRNLEASIFGVAVGNVGFYLFDGELIPWWGDLFFLGWGVVSFILGIICDAHNK